MRYAVALTLSVLFWLIAWYLDTAQSMVAIWQRSDTFAHGYLIVPISAWMIWRRREQLAALDPRPSFVPLVLAALVGVGWLAGRLAGAGVVEQFALVLMIPLVVWGILGAQIMRAIAFPLFFLLFAVPFGEFLEPPLMEHTANFAVFALRLSGIPVYREGLFFTLPTGNWSVVEACSGLRYLIASVTLGFLYAYLTYRSTLRRAIFVACSFVVPIVANWLRAYMIVMIGHLSGMKYAVGVDHLIYGWLFFGVVMLILFWIGSFWREDLEPEEAPSPAPQRPRGQAVRASMVPAAIAAALVIAFWPVMAARVDSSSAGWVQALRAPQPAAGWRPVSGRLSDWTPRLLEPRFQINQTYAKDAANVGLYIAYYRNQWQGSQLISSRNTMVPSEHAVWRSYGESRRDLTIDGAMIAPIEADLRSPATNLLVWRWYWVAGRFTVHPYAAKLLQARSQLLGDGDDGAVVVIYAPYGDQPRAGERALEDFAKAMLPSITRSLDDARRAQPRS